MSIKRRIVFAFAILATTISAIFILFSFALIYTVEDNFFERIIHEEAQYITKNLKETGDLLQPRRSFLNSYQSISQTPAEFRHIYQQNPGKVEYAGLEGRHYHVYQSDSPSFVIVAEVSQYLVVRPVRFQILKFLIISTLVIVVFAVAISYWLAVRATKPLSVLTELINHVTPEQLPVDFAKQFPNNEIGILAKNIESSMLRIKHFIEREQHFTRDASHELRTPVAIVKNSIELINTQPLTEQQQTLINRMEQANWQMEQTISTLLSLARESTSNLPASAIAILPIVEDSIVSLADKISEKDIEISIGIARDLVLNIDGATLKIILINLINNALEHSDGDQITICADESSFTVADTGKGFALPTEQAVTDASKSNSSKGFGIGLSLVKRLCEHYQYDLAILSSEQGASITISL